MLRLAVSQTHLCYCVLLQDELLSTELLFRGLLSGLSPDEAVALMSALVFQVTWLTHNVSKGIAHYVPDISRAMRPASHQLAYPKLPYNLRCKSHGLQ